MRHTALLTVLVLTLALAATPALGSPIHLLSATHTVTVTVKLTGQSAETQTTTSTNTDRVSESLYREFYGEPDAVGDLPEHEMTKISVTAARGSLVTLSSAARFPLPVPWEYTPGSWTVRRDLQVGPARGTADQVLPE